MTPQEMIAQILNRREEIVNACLGAAHAVDVATNDFFALFIAGAYAPLDWDVDPLPLPVPALVGATINGKQFTDDLPEPYAAIPENFVAAMSHLASSPILHFCQSITFDKTMARITFCNGDQLLYRNHARPQWIPAAVTIVPGALKLLNS